MLEKHNGNIFETFKASLVLLIIASVKMRFTKSPVAAMFFMPKINRLPSMSNVNDCTKFEDNRSRQSGLTAHTRFKNWWWPS